ncbi:aspartate/glutamate racemase family protein [Chloroflexota bacterium]
MKTIGLIGGMSWESSSEYYRIINQVVRDKLGGLHSARSVMVSVDFASIEELQSQDRWNEATEVMIDTARQVEVAGADFLLIATNTMHKMYSEVQAALDIPVFHIADATGLKIKEYGLDKVGLLGTIYTMEQDFYKGRLNEKFGFQVLVPEKPDRRIVNRIIFEELVVGQVKPESKAEYTRIIYNLIRMGVKGIILGCTEIPLLVDSADVTVPTFDTTYIHAEMAVEIALGERGI